MSLSMGNFSIKSFFDENKKTNHIKQNTYIMFQKKG